MASQSRARGEELAIPAVLTLALHALLAIGLVIAGWFARIEPPPPKQDDEVDIEPPRPRPPPAPIVVPRVALPEPRPLPPPPDPAAPRSPALVHVSRAPAAPDPARPPPPTTEPPAGSDTAPAEGDPIVLPDVFVGSGDVEVGHGTRGGTGGRGGGGTGNQPQGTGGTGPPAPVSIASIKKRALPIGEVDYVSIRDYPDEAKKLGIGGEIKIRLVVDDAGRVTDRTPINKLGHGLDQLAMRIAAKLRFEPAVDSADRKVSSIVVWKFTFVPPE
ncbi:MAG TPA: TonB family protein [Kofleriaceae bacterium]|nr:TonB family protein [Kofleriaceae bacterium]